MKTVFFDVDTQLDFLLPAGALYVPGAEAIIPQLSRLAQFAAASSIPLVSTVDAHTEDDQEFRTWKPHCVAGTVGQQKAQSTLLPQSFILPSTPIERANVERNAELSAQIQVEKQHTDCFTNPNLKTLLSWLQADRYVVYGVVTEICVQEAVFGLLALGGHVSVVVDAVRSLNQAKADALFDSVQKQGGSLTTMAAITG